MKRLVTHTHVEVRKRNRAADSRRIMVRVEGRGVPMVWGHTLMGSMAQEDELGVFGWQDINDIARIVRYDAAGHGSSDDVEHHDHHDWESLARDMWQVADSFAGEQVILGGASMGCATALHAACQRPRDVLGLVLTIPPTGWEERARQIRQYRRAIKLLDAFGVWPLLWSRHVASFSRHLFPGDFRQRLGAATLRNLDIDRVAAIRKSIHGACRSDMPDEEAIAALNVPTLILAWTGDRVHPMSTVENLQRLMPRAQVVVAKNKSDPFRWVEHVREFVGKIAGTRPSAGTGLARKAAAAR